MCKGQRQTIIPHETEPIASHPPHALNFGYKVETTGLANHTQVDRFQSNTSNQWDCSIPIAGKE